MNVLFLGHAGLLVEAAGRRILIDPWFGEPVFSRAWWRYPPPPYPTAASLPPVDLLLLSHTHPDHAGVATLRQLPRNTPVHAVPYPSGQMRRRLRAGRLDDARWMPLSHTTDVLPGVRLTFVANDRGWEVASIVLEANGVRLYHGNDNTLSVPAYRRIASELGRMDVAFLPFAGASSYPTCFEWDRATIDDRALDKKHEGISRFTDGIEGLRPRVAVPFASNWALLESRHLWKNYLDRPSPHEAAEAAAPVAGKTGTELLVLDPGDEWRSGEGAVRHGLTAGWTYDAAGAARYAAQMQSAVSATLDRRAEAPQPEALDRAMHLYFAEILSATPQPIGELRMTAEFVAEGHAAGPWHVVFDGSLLPELRRGPAPDADVSLALPANELWSILTGPDTWEDPWYGYRLRVRQRQDAPYHRVFWEMLLNFDSEPVAAKIRRKLGRA